jgi:hypothetical protein
VPAGEAMREAVLCLAVLGSLLLHGDRLAFAQQPLGWVPDTSARPAEGGSSSTTTAYLEKAAKA